VEEEEDGWRSRPSGRAIRQDRLGLMRRRGRLQRPPVRAPGQRVVRSIVVLELSMHHPPVEHVRDDSADQRVSGHEARQPPQIEDNESYAPNAP